MSEQHNQTGTAQRPGGFGRGPMGGHGMMPGEKAKDFKGTFRRLFSYLRPYHGVIAVVVAAAVASCVFAIAGPKIMARATNKLFEGVIAMIAGTGEIDFGYIGGVLLLLIGLYAVSCVLSYLQGYLMTDVTQKVTYQLRKDISAKINRLPLRYFDRTSAGDVLSRVTSDIDTLGQSLNQSLTQIITSVTTVLGVLVMMLTISPLMTLVALLVLPVSMLFVLDGTVSPVDLSNYYTKAQVDAQVAATHGMYFFDVDSNGHLQEYISEYADDLVFALTSVGHLEVTL